MKIVFFGTPDYVLPTLERLHKEYVRGPGVSPIVAVVTQSPKPTGRKQILEYSPIDKWAHERNIATFYSAQDFLEANIDAEIGILAAYSEILPDKIISYFPQGILNIHPSLLPKLRGASPVQSAIITDGKKTGGTVMKMDSKLDHGQIITQFEEDILPNDTFGTLRTRLFEKSEDVLIELLTPYIQNKIHLKTQNEDEATFTRTIKKDDAFLKLEILAKAVKGEVSEEKISVPFIKDFSMDATPTNINNFVRALDPWPNVWTTMPDGRRLKILKSHVENKEGYAQLILDEVQIEGKNPVNGQQFLNAYGDIFPRK